MLGCGFSQQNMLRRLVCIVAAAVVAVSIQPEASAEPSDLLVRFVGEVEPQILSEYADAYGEYHETVPAIELLGAGSRVGWAFLTSDFVSTTGYSGKPIHTMVGIDVDAVVTGVEIVEHAEPIVLIGIPESKIRAATERYRGLDLKKEAAAGGTAHEADIVAGATVTIIVIDDSIIRAGLKVSRALGLGGLAPPPATTDRTLQSEILDDPSWVELVEEGSIGQLSLDVGQVNRAFAEHGDTEAAGRPEPGSADETFIDMRSALVSVPTIGRALLGEVEYQNLTNELDEGEEAILVLGRGRYSFKGSGYVRGGLFDRIQLIQGDTGVRFSDKQHRRLGRLAPDDALTFEEMDIFRIPAGSGFDPTRPWRLQLLVQRAIGPVRKSFLTFDLPGGISERYVVAPEPAKSAILDIGEEASAKADLWRRIWLARSWDIAGLLLMLGTLTGAFFFQIYFTRSERLVFLFRMGFLTLTLVFLGWYANAQLSIVNLMALAGSLGNGFTWEAFLLDPMVFILWFSVAASLIFWGRGAYCGWLCPFGALQELTNRLGRLLRVPQWDVPWVLHERLWAFKYLIFLGLFGIALASIPLAERYAEVEPFKTAIILKFARTWPYIAYVAVLLAVGLFVERFYCRYLCPLGAALAIPARMRTFDWLKRYRECGTRCHICSDECFVKAIHPTGEINPNECLYCLHCQVRYQDTEVCPVCIKRARRGNPPSRDAAPAPSTMTAEPN
jgi:NosR/NirI family transcriptional regulator, nitrous oxide reductase regulator